MMTVSTLARIAGHAQRTGRFEPLLDAVTRNGRPLPLRLRLALSTPENAAAAALALATQRACELAWGPDPAVRTLVGLLIDRQRPDGAFGAGGASLAVTAAALAALRVAADHGVATGAGADALDGADGALVRLADSAMSVGDADPAVLVAALWQLGGVPALARRPVAMALAEFAADLGVHHDAELAPLARAPLPRPASAEQRSAHGALAA